MRWAARLTVHDHLHIIQKTMNDGEGLRHGHAGLFLCESVQSLEYRLDLAVSQQLLCELLCDTYRVRGSRLLSQLDTAY
jgi:anti-sigma regulatory factor (Ser/Thr protein kinase)